MDHGVYNDEVDTKLLAKVSGLKDIERFTNMMDPPASPMPRSISKKKEKTNLDKLTNLSPGSDGWAEVDPNKDYALKHKITEDNVYADKLTIRADLIYRVTQFGYD